MLLNTVNKTCMALLLACLWSTGAAFAQDSTAKYDIEVEVHIPHPRFFVVPVDAWHLQLQTLQWDGIHKTLRPMSFKQLNMKSTMGPIRATLTSEAKMVNEDKSIALVVKINDQELNHVTPVEVYSIAEMGRERLAVVNVRAVPNGPGDTFLPGEYMGVVSMMFETIEP